MSENNNAQSFMSHDILKLAKKKFIKFALWGGGLLLIGICLSFVEIQAKYSICHGLIEVLSVLLISVGGTLITASTLGFVLADNDYQGILKGQMVDVLLSPETYRTLDQNKIVWRRITEYLLKSVLPFGNRHATDLIEKALLDDEREYHFEHYKSEFFFTVDEKDDVLEIKQIVRCNLVISPDCEDPILKQFVQFKSNTEYDVDFLRINEQDVDIKKEATPSVSDPKRLELNIPLRKYIDPKTKARSLTYHRQIIYRQSFSKEPYFCMDLMRYAKGFIVETNIDSKYKVIPEGFGDPKPEFPPAKPNGGPETKRYVVRNTDELLLPGYGYILLVLADPTNQD